ncbi:hypothetical protein BDZ94DRAFT_1216623 [Collybia nuda]|uniref:Alpha/beta-hydrolase n=1 Tax=Collybia nuda TaxID=64659 RepID=A0A9P5Y6Z4_9AGAR|nr:hypothetical protein BDZ94DRAFT_1216623 [Collybia nuda]
MAYDIAEIPLPSRNYTFSYYIVLVCLVAPLWSSVLASWAFVIHSLWSGRIWTFAWPHKFVFAVTLCEVFFSVYHYHLSQHVSGPTPHGPGELIEIQAAYSRLLKAGLASLPEAGDDEESDRPGSPEEVITQLDHDDPRAIDFRNSLRTWFSKAPWSSIKLREVQKWLYWSIFNADLPPLDKISHSQRTVLDEALGLLQKRSGSIIQEGSNPTIQPIRLTLDRVNTHWRPLTYYTAINSVNWFLRTLYKTKWKVLHGHYDGLEYLVRLPKHWDPTADPRPIVFIHGLGLGFLQYNHLITHLLKTFVDRPVLILLQPQISQNIFHPQFLKPMTKYQMANRLARLMEKLGWVFLYQSPKRESSGEHEEEKEITSLIVERNKGVTMISHSNGSYIHAWMLKIYPSIVSRSCFVDPVTFCSWEGDVCYNFIYRPCRTGIELLMRYFVGTEIGVANLLQRHFDWVSNSLWYDEIPNAQDPSKTLFLLGGKDDIICSERVKRYLTSHGVRKGLWYDPKGKHGQALVSGSDGHAKILGWLKELDIAK